MKGCNGQLCMYVCITYKKIVARRLSIPRNNTAAFCDGFWSTRIRNIQLGNTLYTVLKRIFKQLHVIRTLSTLFTIHIYTSIVCFCLLFCVLWCPFLYCIYGYIVLFVYVCMYIYVYLLVLLDSYLWAFISRWMHF